MNIKDLEYKLSAFNEAKDAALESFNLYRAQIPRQDIITCINFTEPSYRKRLFVFDVYSGNLLRAHHVSHGIKSSALNPAFCNKFSNAPGSHKSSTGAMLTAKTYVGKHGLSLVLKGFEPRINGNVERRFIVVHAADYVTDKFILNNGYAGRSHGCPAVDPTISKSLISMIKEGTFFYIFYKSQ